MLDNSNVPQLPAVSEMDKASLRSFLDQMLLLFGVLGMSVFQKPAVVSPSARLLHIKGRGRIAIGYEVDGGFVVRAGSESPKKSVPSTPDYRARSLPFVDSHPERIEALFPKLDTPLTR